MPLQEPPPQVFISYAHDSRQHKDLVLQFATFLRVRVGMDVRLDQWDEGPRRDWAAWACEHLQSADFVLVVASPDYRRRSEGQSPPDEGRGSQYEAAIIRNHLIRDLPAETQRVLPVVLPGGSVDDIPGFLCGHSTTHYRIAEFTMDGVEELRRAFSGQPASRLPHRGQYTPITSRNDGKRQSRTHEADSAEAETISPPPVTYSGIVFLGNVTHHGDNINGTKNVHGLPARGESRP